MNFVFEVIDANCVGNAVKYRVVDSAINDWNAASAADLNSYAKVLMNNMVKPSFHLSVALNISVFYITGMILMVI
jgi:hypothetical protein